MEKYNYSLKYIRRQKILENLGPLPSDKERIDVLVEKCMNLQDTLLELQESYVQVCLNYKKLSELYDSDSCAHLPF